ncbi:IS1 family transposase [soil metagenome]
MANRLSTEQRARIVGCLVEGNSIRATVRMTGAAKNTVVKLLVDLGAACSAYQDETLRGLDCQRVQVDEIWSFVGAKQKNVTAEHPVDFGDVWTYVAIDADTKLVPAWLVGQRTAEDAELVLRDLASRLTGRIQLTTDGLRVYAWAAEGAFGGEVDYAMLIKLYGNSPQGPQTRYSPAPCVGTEVKKVSGAPDPAHIATSYVERQNLTMRMGMRRFTRLTNAFSKKVENVVHAVSLHFMFYNFARPHQTLTKANGGRPTTPAMAAGVADQVWTLRDIAGLLDQPQSN